MTLKDRNLILPITTLDWSPCASSNVSNARLSGLEVEDDEPGAENRRGVAKPMATAGWLVTACWQSISRILVNQPTIPQI